MTNDFFKVSPSSYDYDAFIQTFGGIYEHSDWVAKAAFKAGLKESDDTLSGLCSNFAGIVDAAQHEQKLTLLKAHPELAGKLAVEDKLTEESKNEQAGAGLDKCSPEEFQRFQELNAQYNEKFGFPFIIAVKGLNRHNILEAFETRVNNDYETEFTTALSQVHKIARLRLSDLV